MRLDLFLKTGRLVKRRAVARKLIDEGWVSVNGTAAKPSKEVRPGDRIILTFSSRTVELEILVVPAPGNKRVAPEQVYRIIAEKRNEQPADVWTTHPSSS